jgi:drug/metabolite transporter (DMT)-like permease
MLFDYGCIAVVALAWGSWPLFARSSGLGGPLGSLLLMIFGIAPIALAVLLQRDFAPPPAAALGKLAIAGGLMGIGLIAFNLLANAKMDASTSIPIVDAAMLVVTASGAIYFFGEPLSTQKVLGVVLLLAGIALLRPS